jgi:putative salt-induced outer membrane protein YdiY
MKKSIKTVAVMALLLPFVSFADGTVTNVTWKNNLKLGATYKSGNTSQTLFSGDLKGDRYAPKSDWINLLHGEYGKTEGDQTEGQVRAQSDYRYKFGTENFFGGAFAELNHDSIKDIQFRAKAGPNVGYYFINREDMKLDLSFGANGVYEKVGGDENTYGEFRLAGNYLWDFTKTATYYLSAEYTAQMDELGDNTGLLVTGVKSKVSEKLAMYIELRDEYDNTVEGDVESNDVTITAGLGYDF